MQSQATWISHLKPQRLLALPKVYSAFAKLMAKDGRQRFVRDFLRPFPGARMLDLGCGPGDILNELPDSVHYLGIDHSEDYIAAASATFAGRGVFRCGDTSECSIDEASFDIVMANGVFHHLTDNQGLCLAKVAAKALKPGGRLLTLDGCFEPGQPLLARMALKADRGEYVREQKGYEDLLRPYFSDLRVTLIRDLIRIPYTHIIIEAVKA